MPATKSIPGSAETIERIRRSRSARTCIRANAASQAGFGPPFRTASEPGRGPGFAIARTPRWTVSLVALAAAAGWMARSATEPVAIPRGIVALSQETRSGGQFVLEVGPAGEVIAYSAEIDPSAVPEACRDAVDNAHPGGTVISAAKEVVDGKTYFEIEKDVDGLRLEVLTTPEGRIAGFERALPAQEYPAAVLAAANGLVPDGEVAAVERVEGPESLGPPEHHVKKMMAGGELVRIRVTDQGAVQILRKLKSELKTPRR